MIENKNKKLVIKTLLIFLLPISLLLANFFLIQWAFAETETDQNVSDLNQQIDGKKKEISILQKEIDAYEEQIKAKQKEVKTLRNQVAILENQIAKLNLDIEATTKKIEQTNLEIQNLNLEIESLEQKIDSRKEKVAEYIRLINKNDEVSYFEVLLVNDSFSDFFDRVKYIEEIHSDLNNALTKLKADKADRESKKVNLEQKAKDEEQLKEKLVQQMSDLTEKNNAQEFLLLQTRLTERQYQSYLYQLQLEQQQINSDIITLEKTVRKKLEDLKKDELFKQLGPAALGWPVSPTKGISAYFHDPDYPFRYIFEHPAIDVRVAQKTQIKAPESGYVGRVKFAGDKTYAYIMLIHNDGLSTVFGHVSAVYVKEDEYVTKGQVIGLSGGSPGTTGAGNLSTGPHLHFEVRLNGIPVNPLEYLPAI